MTEWMDMVSGYGVCTSTFLLCFVSGLVPVINSELVLIGVSSMVKLPLVLPVAFWATLGQMAAKALCYYAGQGLLQLAPVQYRRGLQQLEVRQHRYFIQDGYISLKRRKFFDENDIYQTMVSAGVYSDNVAHPVALGGCRF